MHQCGHKQDAVGRTAIIWELEEGTLVSLLLNSQVPDLDSAVGSVDGEYVALVTVTVRGTDRQTAPDCERNDFKPRTVIGVLQFVIGEQNFEFLYYSAVTLPLVVVDVCHVTKLSEERTAPER